MIKIEEIKSYINEDMLDTAFNDREEKIYNIDINNKELEKIKKDNTMTYDRFQEIIKNLPPHFQNCREAILESFEKYANRQNLIQSFDNEKFYKVGFCDGVKMILDITKKKSN